MALRRMAVFAMQTERGRPSRRISTLPRTWVFMAKLTGKAGEMKIAAIVAAAVCAAALAGTSAASADTGTSVPVAERINAYKISPVTMVDNAGGRQADGNAVQMWSRGNKANEEWGYSPVTSVFFQIRYRGHSGTYCLDLAGGSLKSGTKIQLWKCISGDLNQLWYQGPPTGDGPIPGPIYPDRTYGKNAVVIDGGSGKNGTRLEIEPWKQSGGQLFNFES